MRGIGTGRGLGRRVRREVIMDCILVNIFLGHKFLGRNYL